MVKAIVGVVVKLCQLYGHFDVFVHLLGCEFDHVRVVVIATKISIVDSFLHGVLISVSASFAPEEIHQLLVCFVIKLPLWCG